MGLYLTVHEPCYDQHDRPCGGRDPEGCGGIGFQVHSRKNNHHRISQRPSHSDGRKFQAVFLRHIHHDGIPDRPYRTVKKAVNEHTYGKQRKGIRPVIAQDARRRTHQGQSQNCHMPALPVGNHTPKGLHDQSQQRPDGGKKADLRNIHSPGPVIYADIGAEGGPRYVK